MTSIEYNSTQFLNVKLNGIEHVHVQLFIVQFNSWIVLMAFVASSKHQRLLSPWGKNQTNSTSMVAILALTLKAPISQINNIYNMTCSFFILHQYSLPFLFSAILKVKQSLSLKDNCLEIFSAFQNLDIHGLKICYWCLGGVFLCLFPYIVAIQKGIFCGYIIKI